ncbi:MAG: pirin family protein [Planctomycetes bacterium]|nr:pirin family protein [Planctomycetota bacterium]MCW8137012.1 pirin family protein [Planctomycetota bacterium]
MTELATIDAIYGPPAPHWVGDGFPVRGYFSYMPGGMRRLSPFLLLDYAQPYDFEPTDNMRRGVGPHPHRGFETVTIAYQGSVAHHDSAGNGGVIHPGDVQWMTAGSGILHREYHAAEFARKGGTFQMAQIWVNLPAEHKMTEPAYQALTASQMGVAKLPKGSVTVIAGEFAGAKGPARTFTPINMFTVRLEAGGTVDLPLPEGWNAGLLVMSGDVHVNGKDARGNDLVVFKRGSGGISVRAETPAELLLLSGQPIDEPVANYGPFVMNTPEEIEQAIRDFHAGKFGQLDE